MVSTKSGFSLMELIAVLAIISILSTIAYPTYVHVKINARRTDGQGAVVATEGMIERYLAENNKANIDSGDMALAQFSNYAAGSGSPVISKGGYYKISIVPDSSGYAVNATAIASGTTNACSAVANVEALDECSDTDCWIISIKDGQKQSTNSVGTVANASTTTCW